MKKIFLEYLNELIYMLKEYENSWLSEHIVFEEYIMYVSQNW